MSDHERARGAAPQAPSVIGVSSFNTAKLNHKKNAIYIL
jgi:hypothetical protein